MNRFRGTDVALGLVAIVVNIGLVVGVVSMTSGEESAGALPSRSPSVSASASATPSPSATRPAGPPTTRQLFASGEPVSIAVLGDQTSDGDSEWVGVFAALLGRDRTATVRTLDPSDPTVYSGKRTYGSSGPRVTIHNASRAGVKADYAARRLPLLVPDEADVVVLNYGRNDDAERVVSRLTKTAKAIRTQLPGARVVVTLQPPTAGDSQGDVRTAIRKWAKKSGLTVLDVAKAFVGTGQPDAYISPLDPLVMSGVGDQLWGEVAYTALTGEELPTPSTGTAAGPTATGTAGVTTAGPGTGGSVTPAPTPSDTALPPVAPTASSPQTPPPADPSPSSSPST